MAKVTQGQLDRELREQAAEKLTEVFAEHSPLLYGSGKITFYLTDSAGNERAMTIDATIRKGSRDGEPWDCEAMAELYQESLEKERVRKETAEIRSREQQAKRAAREAEKAARLAAKEALKATAETE